MLDFPGRESGRHLNQPLHSCHLHEGHFPRAARALLPLGDGERGEVPGLPVEPLHSAEAHLELLGRHVLGHSSLQPG